MTDSIQTYMHRIGKAARLASRVMASASTEAKNNALQVIAELLLQQKAAIIDANNEDMRNARKKQLEPALLERLELNDSRIDSMIEGLRQVAALPDPIGEIASMQRRPNGIELGKMRVPLGVVGIIYESRPNVTIDAASLCLKSGNAAILRGGSEAIASNSMIAKIVSQGLEQTNLPADAVQVVSVTDRQAVSALITMTDFVDVIVPRGGKGLIARISNEAKIPVIKHLDGNCHVYIDDSADMDKAMAIAVNSKTHRYGVCNAMETLLVSAAIAPTILPKLAKAYVDLGVELRGCSQTREIIDSKAATEEDWYEEYLAPVLAIKIVAGIDEAIEHINHYSSSHTDSIVTENYSLARQFVRAVDSSSVMVNTSTRFADGFEYGLGAEIGISTDKIHARGPVGLEGLTSQKWVVYSDGKIRL